MFVKSTCFKQVCQLLLSLIVACVASVSVRSMSKERGTRVNCCAKNGASKRAGKGVGKEKKETLRQIPGFLKTTHLACHA